MVCGQILAATGTIAPRTNRDVPEAACIDSSHTSHGAALIESTPKEQAHFIVNKDGHPYEHENYPGDAASQRRDRLGIRPELRLYDARGTAATRLLLADASLKEIATCMGWSIRHAAEVISRYAALSPEMSDGIAKKLEAARKGS